MVRTCREWESRHQAFLDTLFTKVFAKLDGLADERFFDSAGDAAQIASHAVEVLLHCVDPAGRMPGGECVVNIDRVREILNRLEGNFRDLRKIAESVAGEHGRPADCDV